MITYHRTTSWSSSLRLLSRPHLLLDLSLQAELPAEGEPHEDWSMLGSMLFSRGVSGCRVVAKGQTQSVAALQFQGYGGHHDAYPHSYLTVAAAVGTQPADIDAFLSKLAATLHDLARQRRKAAARRQTQASQPGQEHKPE